MAKKAAKARVNGKSRTRTLPTRSAGPVGGELRAIVAKVEANMAQKEQLRAAQRALEAS